MSPVHAWVILLCVGVSGAEQRGREAPPPESLNITITFSERRANIRGKYICTPAEKDHDNYHCQRHVQAPGPAASCTNPAELVLEFPNTAGSGQRSRGGEDRSNSDEEVESTAVGSHRCKTDCSRCNGGKKGNKRNDDSKNRESSDRDETETAETNPATGLSRDAQILLPILLILLLLIIVGALLWTWKYKCHRKQRTHSAGGDSVVAMKPKKNVTTLYVTASDPGATGDPQPLTKSHHLYQEIHDVPVESSKRPPDTTYSTAGAPYDIPQPVSPAQPPADGTPAQ